MTSAFRRQPLSRLRADTLLSALPLGMAHLPRRGSAGETAEGDIDDDVVLDGLEWNRGGLRAETKAGDHICKPLDERFG